MTVNLMQGFSSIYLSSIWCDNSSLHVPGLALGPKGELPNAMLDTFIPDLPIRVYVNFVSADTTATINNMKV